MGFFSKRRRAASSRAHTNRTNTIQALHRDGETQDTVIFFSPHQDDELLTMGVAAANIKSSHVINTHVVLCTDGSASAVFATLANEEACQLHDGLHSYRLTESQFVNARDVEFSESCAALGYRPCELHFPFVRAKDKCLSQEIARQLILSALAEVPDAKVCTIMPLECDFQHVDHTNLGKAAMDLFEEGQIRELDLYVEPYLVDKLKEAGAGIWESLHLETMAPESEEASERLDKAIAAYCRWDPDNKRYAIGRHSVKSEFTDFVNSKLAYHRLFKK